MTLRDKRDGWVVRLAGLIPHPILANPERILINVACVLIGIAALWPPPDSLFAVWGPEFAIFWGTSIIVGGIAGIAGHITGYRPFDRLGALAVGGASFVFSGGLLWEFGFARISTAIIFFCLGVAKLVRLLRSISIRVAIERHLRELDDIP